MRAAPSRLYAPFKGYIMAEMANQAGHASERTPVFMRIPIGKKEGEVKSALRIIRAQLLCGKSYRKQV